MSHELFQDQVNSLHHLKMAMSWLAPDRHVWGAFLKQLEALGNDTASVKKKIEYAAFCITDGLSNGNWPK